MLRVLSEHRQRAPATDLSPATIHVQLCFDRHSRDICHAASSNWWGERHRLLGRGPALVLQLGEQSGSPSCSKAGLA